MPLAGSISGEPSAKGVLEGGIIKDGTSPEGVPQEGVLEHLEQPISPGVASLESSSAASSPLQQRKHSRLEVTPAVTRAGTAARSFLKRNAISRPNSAQLAATITGPALSELRGLKLYTRMSLPDIAHETHRAESAVEYAYATTNVRNMKVIPINKPRPYRPRRRGRRLQARTWQA